MKKTMLIVVSILALSLTACPNDTVVKETPGEIEGRPVWVMNSNWETVKTDTLSASSRVIDSLEALNEEIAIHNAAYPENPWTIYLDTVPSIENAPKCEVWIADPVTNVWKTNPSDGSPYHLLVDRVLVSGRRWAWEIDAAAVGGKLYLDYPPPPEVAPPPPPTAEEIHLSHYHYVIDPAQNGKIMFSVNCVDEWETLGYPSMEQCHYWRTTAFTSETMGTGYVRVDGYLYTEPE